MKKFLKKNFPIFLLPVLAAILSPNIASAFIPLKLTIVNNTGEEVKLFSSNQCASNDSTAINGQSISPGASPTFEIDVDQGGGCSNSDSYTVINFINPHNGQTWGGYRYLWEHCTQSCEYEWDDYWPSDKNQSSSPYRATPGDPSPQSFSSMHCYEQKMGQEGGYPSPCEKSLILTYTAK